MEKKHKRIRTALALIDMIIWGLAVTGLVRHWAWLDKQRMAGLLIFSLFMLLLAIPGALSELHDGMLDDNVWQGVGQHYLLLGRVMALIFVWLGGAWGLLRLIAALFSAAIAYYLFLAAFAGWSGLIIQGLVWLADRDWKLKQ